MHVDAIYKATFNWRAPPCAFASTHLHKSSSSPSPYTFLAEKVLEKKSAGETAAQNIAHPEIQENAQQLINPLTTDISTKNLS